MNTAKKKLRIALFGSYNHTLPSSTLIQNGLLNNAAQHEVVVIHEPVPVSFIQNAGHLGFGEIFKRFWNRVVAFVKLLLRFREVLKADVLVVLTPGQVDMIQASFYRFVFGKKILYAPQISFYDLLRTVLKDDPSKQLLIKMAYHIERFLFKCANMVVFSTKQEVEYHKKLLDLPTVNFGVVPLGADDSIFYPEKKKKKASAFEVLYYGEYIPAHGAKTVAAAGLELQKHKDIHFTMIGEGREKASVVEIVTKGKAKNIELKGWMSPQELATHVREADVVIGMLGDDPLVKRVIPNKVFQSMASAKSVITSESPAITDVLKQKKDIYIIPPEDTHALSNAILELQGNDILRETIGKNAYKTFTQSFNSGAIASVIISQLETLL